MIGVIILEGGIGHEWLYFCEYLYQKRKQSGDSQNELVEKLGVTGKAVSKWENGSAKPRACLKNILSCSF